MANNENAGSLNLPRKAKGFLVKAELKLSPGMGIGVFAAQFIPANTKVGEHKLIYYDEHQTNKILEQLSSDEERKKWLEHSFGLNGQLVVHDSKVDYGGTVNHSDHPTLVLNGVDGCTYSTRDIQNGEELTEDYGTYDKIPLHEELCEKYSVYDWFIKSEINKS